jgi:hypothetical protein
MVENVASQTLDGVTFIADSVSVTTNKPRQLVKGLPVGRRGICCGLSDVPSSKNGYEGRQWKNFFQ